MFFEDDEKELSKNMDDYDLDFSEDKSIGWDKLLDDADEAAGQGVEPVEAQLQFEDSVVQESVPADDMLLVDDGSFDNMMAGQGVNDAEYTQAQQDFAQELTQVEPDIDYGLGLEDDITAAPQPVYEMPQEVYQEPVQEQYYSPETQTQQYAPEQEVYAQEMQEEQEPPAIPIPPPPSVEAPRSVADEDEDDIDYNADYSKNPQKSNNAGALGIVAASALIVAVVAVVFVGKSYLVPSPVSTGDATQLTENNQVQDIEQDVADPFAEPVTGNTPGAANDLASGGDGAAPVAGFADAPVAPAKVNLPNSPDAKKAAAINGKDKLVAKDNKLGEKTIVKVETLGRVNPFIPIANINNLGFISAPAMDVLEPPSTVGDMELSGLVDELMKITVSGILFDNAKPSAIVTVDNVDYFVQKGDMIEDYVVAGITKNTVLIKKGTNIYSASIGQSFSNAPIDGQINRTANKGISQRQYVKPEEINVNERDGQSGGRYGRGNSPVIRY